VRQGEILGIAGVDGNGQRELVECIAGLRRVTEGRITIDGRSPADALQTPSILGLVPEDRHQQGLVGDFDVAENLILKAYDRPPFSVHGLLRWGPIREHAVRQIAAFDIRTRSPQTPVRSLSGGNQQKVVVAREFSRPVKLVIASQPTRGLDVGSIEYIHKRIVEQRDAGAAILIVSTELEEVIAVGDRVAVMFAGQIVGILEGEAATFEAVGMLMGGAH